MMKREKKVAAAAAAVAVAVAVAVAAVGGRAVRSITRLPRRDHREQ